MKILLILLIMIPVLMSGCAEEKKQIALNQSGNVSNYEFEVFLNEWANNKPANTTTYYLLEDRTTAKVVNLEINCSKLEIYPPDYSGRRFGRKTNSKFRIACRACKQDHSGRPNF